LCTGILTGTVCLRILRINVNAGTGTYFPICFRLPDNFQHGDVFNDTAVHVFDAMSRVDCLPDSFWIAEQPVYDDSDLEYIQR
jgi:hypothetical protein